MDRAEALAVLHQILEECQETVAMNSISLEDPPISNSSRGYKIKISCALDNSSRQFIAEILKKRNLFLEELDGFVIIQSNIK